MTSKVGPMVGGWSLPRFQDMRYYAMRLGLRDCGLNKNRFSGSLAFRPAAGNKKAAGA